MQISAFVLPAVSVRYLPIQYGVDTAKR
jgi:hypothetical protein